MAFDKETKYEAHVMKHQFLSNKYIILQKEYYDYKTKLSP